MGNPERTNYIDQDADDYDDAEFRASIEQKFGSIFDSWDNVLAVATKNGFAPETHEAFYVDDDLTPEQQVLERVALADVVLQQLKDLELLTEKEYNVVRNRLMDRHADVLRKAVNQQGGFEQGTEIDIE